MQRVMIAESVVQEAIAREFKCERCGNCCMGEGAVSFGPDEADRMARHLGLTRAKFLRTYAIKVGREEWWLKEQKNEELWCVFLERDADGLYACRVNPSKPNQCRSFPEKWRNEDSFRTCPGLQNLMSALRLRSEEA